MKLVRLQHQGSSSPKTCAQFDCKNEPIIVSSSFISKNVGSAVLLRKWNVFSSNSLSPKTWVRTVLLCENNQFHFKLFTFKQFLQKRQCASNWLWEWSKKPEVSTRWIAVGGVLSSAEYEPWKIACDRCETVRPGRLGRLTWQIFFASHLKVNTRSGFVRAFT